MGAGFASSDGGHPKVHNCLFKGNTALSGAGAYFQTANGARLKDCIFTQNATTAGCSGIELSFSRDIKISNCTFYKSSPSNDDTAVINCWKSSVSDPIIMENIIIAWSERGVPVNWTGGCVIDVSYSDFFGNPGGNWVGPLSDVSGKKGNISKDPQFKDKAAGDLSLLDSSPCKDTGNPGSPNDPDGTPADMGAFLK